MGVVVFAIVYFVPMFLALDFGSGTVETIINFIPEVVMNGLTKASSVLPALGIALLMNYIMDKDVTPFIFLGFILAAFLGVSSLGVAGLGAVIAVVYYNMVQRKANE